MKCTRSKQIKMCMVLEKLEVGDLVWVHLHKERFSGQRKHKLMPRAEGPFEVLERIKVNAYKIDLCDKHDVLATLNTGNLASYLEDEELRKTPFKEEKDDEKSIQEHSKDLFLAKSFEDSSSNSYGLFGPFLTSLVLICISRSS